MSQNPLPQGTADRFSAARLRASFAGLTEFGGLQTASLALAAVAAAAAWPVSAYLLGPAVAPTAALAAGAAVLTLTGPEYGIAFALALAPELNAQNVPVFSNVFPKPFQVLLPILAGVVLVYSLILHRQARSSGRLWFPATAFLLVSVLLLSSILGIDPGGSVKKVVLLLTGLALFLAVRAVGQNRRALLIVTAGALGGLLIAAIAGVLQYRSGTLTGGFLVNGTFVGRAQGSFGHPNEYGGFLAFLIPVAVAVLIHRTFPRWIRALAGVGLVFGVPALIFSYSRGAIVALAVGGLIWLAFTRPRIALVSAVAAAIAAVTLTPAALKERFGSTSQGEVTLRSDIWGAAIDINSTHPVLGVGLNNFPTAYQSLPSNLLNASQRRLLVNQEVLIPPSAQSLYLNVLAEGGFIGLAALVLFIVAAMRLIWRGVHVRDPPGRLICMGLGVGLSGLLVQSFVEVTMFSETLLPLFGLLGVAACVVDLNQRERESPEALRA